MKTTPFEMVFIIRDLIGQYQYIPAKNHEGRVWRGSAQFHSRCIGGHEC